MGDIPGRVTILSRRDLCMPGRLRDPAISLGLTLLVLLAWSGRGDAAQIDPQLQRLKLLQSRMVLSEPAEKLERLERWRKLRSRRGRPGQRSRPSAGATDLARPVGPDARGLARAGSLTGVQTPANVRAHDPTGEPGGAVQSEVSIASYGDHVVAAWNDGIGVYNSPETDTQGYAYSVDGGVTWIDGGVPPNTNIGIWDSDPVVVVNEKTGDFY